MISRIFNTILFDIDNLLINQDIAYNVLAHTSNSLQKFMSNPFHIQDADWVGGNLTSKMPLFSIDGGILLVPVEDQVQLFYTSNGSLASSLTSRQVKQHFPLKQLRQAWKISSITHDPQSHNQVYVAHENGCIILWNYESGIPISNIIVSFSPFLTVLDIFTHHDFPEYLFVFWKKNTMYQLSVINRNSTDTKTRNTTMLIPNLPGKSPRRLLITSTNINHSPTITCCYTSDTKLIFYHFDRKSLKLIASKHHNHTTTITTTAYSPSPPCLAIGDISGKITLIYPDQTNHQKIDISISLHWHAHPVQTLAFSHDYKHLLSGGAESVLVLWNLSDNTNQFLPRLGGPINHISVHNHGNTIDDALFYSVSIQHKNAISVLRTSSDLKEQCSIQGCLMPESNHFNSQYNPLSIRDDTRSDPYLILCHSGIVQFYNPSNSFAIKVIPQNLVSATESNIHHMNNMIQYVAFTRDGQWMMLSEWNSYNSRLRFWKYDDDYHQVGMVEHPHNHSRVTGISFHPNAFNFDYQAASIGEDGKIRLWKVSCDGKRHWWSNTNQCSFRSSGPSSPVSIQFSEDGSLILVLYLCKDTFVTLWNSKTLELMHTFYLNTTNPRTNDISIAQFIPNAPSILVTHENNILLWTFTSDTTRHRNISLPMVSGSNPTRLLAACHPLIPNVVAISCFYPEHNKSIVMIWDINSSDTSAKDDSFGTIIAWYCHQDDDNNMIQQISFIEKSFLSLVIIDMSGRIRNIKWNHSKDSINESFKLHITVKEKSIIAKKRKIDNSNTSKDSLHSVIDMIPSHILPSPEQLFSLVISDASSVDVTKHNQRDIPAPIIQNETLKQQFIDMILSS